MRVYPEPVLCGRLTVVLPTYVNVDTTTEQPRQFASDVVVVVDAYTVAVSLVGAAKTGSRLEQDDDDAEALPSRELALDRLSRASPLASVLSETMMSEILFPFLH